MFAPILYFFMLLMTTGENAYQKAEAQAKLALSLPHEDSDSFSFCNDKIKSIIRRDSILNTPGHIGTEYNYPIYKYETEIIYYKNRTIAAIEKKQIELKRYQYNGVTTGIQIITTMDSVNTFYFDQEQHLITHAQLLEIQEKLCSKSKE
ncbi:MAG: hypothetical protein U0U67_11350 [Chitinophagales bacterium]